jgi:hypothetical protein
MFFMGLYPKTLLDRIEPSVGLLLNRVADARAQLDQAHQPHYAGSHLSYAALAAPDHSSR